MSAGLGLIPFVLGCVLWFLGGGVLRECAAATYENRWWRSMRIGGGFDANTQAGLASASICVRFQDEKGIVRVSLFPALLRRFNAHSLVSVMKAEAANKFGGTRLDPLTFVIDRNWIKSTFGWRVIADCSNPSRTGYGTHETITLRSRTGFLTKAGALGDLSEIVASLAPRFPRIRFLLLDFGSLSFFDLENRQWRVFPERHWECSCCDSTTTWPNIFDADTGIVPVCNNCEKAMHEIQVPP